MKYLIFVSLVFINFIGISASAFAQHAGSDIPAAANAPELESREHRATLVPENGVVVYNIDTLGFTREIGYQVGKVESPPGKKTLPVPDITLGWLFWSMFAWYHTLEAELQQGYESIVGDLVDQDCSAERTEHLNSIHDLQERTLEATATKDECIITSNPWHFSIWNSELAEKLENASRNPVLIYTRKFHHGPLSNLFNQSENVALQFWPVDSHNILPGELYEDQNFNPFSKTFNKEDAPKEGRAVRAVVNGTIRENYEVIIQISATGNNFIRMNVESRPLYEFIVHTMATGSIVRFSYRKVTHLQENFERKLYGMRTPYRLYKAEVL